MSLDPFWKEIDAQLDRIEAEKPTTYEALVEIIPGTPGMAASKAFFAGSGGDRQLSGALLNAGWRYLHVDASYYYSMVSPTGAEITYVEGDVYPGDHFAKAEPSDAE